MISKGVWHVKKRLVSVGLVLCLCAQMHPAAYAADVVIGDAAQLQSAVATPEAATAQEPAPEQMVQMDNAALPEVMTFSTTASRGSLVASGSCGENLTWTLDGNGTLTISGTGKMDDYGNYTEGAAPWNEYDVNNSFIKTVKIAAGVTSIGDYAFRGCTGLQSVEIPDSVESLGNYSFSGSGLTEITIPAGVTHIGDKAFSASMLERVTIPGSVSEIGTGAFLRSKRLTSVEIGNGVESIGDYAFDQCPELSEVLLPSSVQKIGDFAFRSCPTLRSIVIPENVTEIGKWAFAYCTALQSITIPSGISHIRDYTFYHCENLPAIRVQEGIETIGYSAFQGCTALREITIPDGISIIYGMAFENCDNLEDVYYGGDASSWASVDIMGRNAPLGYATIHYNSTGPDGEWEAPEYKVYRNGGYEVFDVSLEECLAKTPSTEYNPQLAHMLMAMSFSVKNEAEIKRSFKSFGFAPEDIQTDYSLTGVLAAYGMAKKQGNGQTLVWIAVRGTDGVFGEEMSDNLAGYINPDNGEHGGFADAAEDLLSSRLMNFLGTEDLSDTTFVLTGFSRGAAVANILASRLIDKGVQESNVFAYTFACPDTVNNVSSEVNAGYGSIFNIANAEDFISWAPGGAFSWAPLIKDWDKYGQSYWFSDVWDDYADLEMIFDPSEIHNEEKYLDQLRAEKLLTEYKEKEEAKKALDKASVWRESHQFEALVQKGEDVLTWVGIHCPVDVEVYASGQLVGSVTYNMAQVLDEDKVYISIVGGEKNIYLLDDDTYTFRLTALCEGTMEYFVKNLEIENQKEIDTQTFKNVSLTENKKFVSTVTVKDDLAVDVETQEIKLYVVDESGTPEKEVLPDGQGTEVPLTPAEPDEPNKPADPDEPTAPDKPNEPLDPDEPGRPGDQNEPISSGDAGSNSDEPVEADQSDSPDGNSALEHHAGEATTASGANAAASANQTGTPATPTVTIPQTGDPIPGAWLVVWMAAGLVGALTMAAVKRKKDG